MTQSKLSESVPTQGAAHKSHRKSSKVTFLVIGVVSLLLLVLSAIRVKQSLERKQEIAKERESAQKAALAAPAIAVVKPRPGTFTPHVEVSGTLEPWRAADIGFEVGGRLARILVKAGQEVKQGEVLAVLDGARAGAQVDQASAGLRSAEASAEVASNDEAAARKLFASKSISRAQLQQAEQAAKLARAQLDSARASVQLAHRGAGDHALVAPFAGIITKAPTATGGVVAPGTPMVHIEDLSRFRLRTTVSEDDAPKIEVGAEAVVEFHEQKTKGRVAVIVPSLDRTTRRVPIEIEVANEPGTKLLAWSFVRARVRGSGDVNALRVPGSVRRLGSQNELFVVRDGRADLVRVEHETDANGSWLVTSGLAASDLVVARPSADMQMGNAVSKTVPAEGAEGSKPAPKPHD